MSGDRASYAFRDTATAADRLALVAQVFEPSTRAFLARVGRRAGTIVDVGCGPGHTTRLLADAFPDATVVGLDQSAAFLDEARRAAPAGTSFEQADVTASPLPHAPAATIFARLILSHLRERPAALRVWFDSLAPGGLLLVEDPESIDTTDEVFRTYLRIAGGLIADRGGDLYVGRELGAMAAALGRVRHDDVETVTPTTGEVATIFGLNLSVWRDDPWVTANNESSALGLLADALAARRNMSDRGRITWRMRQTAVERT